MSNGQWIDSEQPRLNSDPKKDYLQRKQPRNGWTTIGGDCPLVRDYLMNKEGTGWDIIKFFVSFTRGFSQVGFANNPITGIIIMIALASIAPDNLAVSTVTGFLGHSISILLKEPAVNINNGLTVFNPIIFGLVSYYFVPKVYGEFDSFSTLMILLGILFIAYFWRSCGSSSIPCLTMPFNLTEFILLFLLKNTQSKLVISTPESLMRRFLDMNNATASELTAIVAAVKANKRFVENATVVNNLDWGMIVRASVVSASQLFVTDSVPMGAIIYLSVMIYSPVTCFFGYMGSLLGSLVGLQVGATYESVYAGLWGLNGYLTGACLGGSFFILNGQVAIATCIAVVFTGILQHVLQIFFIPIGLPVGSIPFVLATWLFIGLGKSPEGSFFYPRTISYPEAQRKEFLFHHRITVKKIQDECEPEVLILDGKDSVT